MPELPIRYLPLTKDNLLPCPHPSVCPFGGKGAGFVCPAAVKDGAGIEGKESQPDGTVIDVLLQPTACRFSK